MEQFKDEVISRVRSCLISTKGQIPIRQLEDDYRTLLGESIPYTKLGFRNLEDFLASAPSLILSRSYDGKILVDAKVSEKTAHISNMVSRQKPVPVKKRTMRCAPPHINRFHPHPPPTVNKWRPQKSHLHYTKRPFQNSPRLAAVSHNQFVHAYPKPSVPSKVVVVPNPPKPVVAPHPQPAPKSPPVQENPSAPKSLNRSPSLNDSNELTSARKRISKLMNEISLDRDSGNSSPTFEYAPSKVPSVVEFARTGNAIVDLKNFALLHKLGEVEVKFTETKAKKAKKPQFHCKVKIGQNTYSSYPEDFYEREAAERHASQRAIDDLIPKHSKRRSLLISSNDDIIARIPPMLEKHNNAVWMWQIEADYVHKYNEQLSADWLQIIDSSQFVSIERCHGGCVLKHCNPDDKGKKIDVSLNMLDVSVSCNTVQFGKNNRIYALVTAANSANEIWCQHSSIPEYNNFIEMLKRMETFYNINKTSLAPKGIHSSRCYAALHEGTWVRVRALDSPKDGLVHCFFFDYGEEVDVGADNIFYLNGEFAVEQAQAFVCRLDGLEDLFEASVDSEHLQALIGKEVVLEMVADENADKDDLTIPVVMYDPTSENSINEELITLLTLETASPVLDKNAVTEVYVSHILNDGEVYVQVRTPGFWKLQEMVDQLSANIATKVPTHLCEPITKHNSQGKQFFVQYKVAKQWRRARIIDWSPNEDMAQIFFIDYGNTDVVTVKSEVMLPLAKLDDVVNRYPAQTIKVQIMIEQIPSNFVEMATRLMPPEQVILLKIISFDNSEVAWVEFYKRAVDGGLFCVNKSISVEAELQNLDFSNNNDEKTRRRLLNLVQFNDTQKNVPSGGSLKKPDLPAKGDYFSVNVPFAVNPWNFFVQPLNSLGDLNSLMEEMQQRYKDFQFSPLPIEDVSPGNIYASRHEDGRWYRTTVLKVIHSGSISVFYCDFGYYTNLTSSQLVPLDMKFMNLPYQALKAKLSGIKPRKNKWTMEDCDVFKNLVTQKQFFSILVDIEKDELYRCDNILKLLLVDTSSTEDVYIKTILVELGIATNT